MLKAIGRWWRKYQRKQDLDILAPIFLEAEMGTQKKLDAVLTHVRIDKAWRDATDEEINEFIQASGALGFWPMTLAEIDDYLEQHEKEGPCPAGTDTDT